MEHFWCNLSRGTLRLLFCNLYSNAKYQLWFPRALYFTLKLACEFWVLGQMAPLQEGPGVQIPLDTAEHYVINTVNKKNNSHCFQKHLRLSQLPDSSGCSLSPPKNPDTQSTNKDHKALQSFLGDLGQQCVLGQNWRGIFFHHTVI